MGRLSENSVVSIKNKSHAVTAEVVVNGGPAQGVIVAQGGSIGGWSLYTKGGRPRYCYNLFGIQRYYVEGDREIPAGTHQVRMEFAYDGVVPHGEGAASGGIFFHDPDGVRLEIYTPSGADEGRAPTAAAPTCGFF